MTAGAKHKELMALQPPPLRHPAAPFPISTKTWVAKERAYPRAGVRLQPDGKWLMQVWYTTGLLRLDEEPLTHDTPHAAFLAAQRDVHAVRAHKNPAGQLHLGAATKEPTA